jgi:hypothetical protein
MIESVRFFYQHSSWLAQEQGTHSVHPSEDIHIGRLVNQDIPLVDDRPFNNGILFLKVVTLDTTVKGFERLHRRRLVSLSCVEPGRLGNPNPKEDHQTDRRKEDSHGKKVIVGTSLVELLHHDGDDDSSDV